VSDQPIRVVPDTSAIIAYAHGSLNVGEVLVEVTDEQASFAVPAVCLVQAATAAADTQLRLLTAHPACRVLPLHAEDWPRLVTAMRIFGRVDLAVSIYATRQADGYVLTAEPDAYGDDGGRAVIPI
jgi:hypothetical protein